ncbi:hypothetical protein PENTCL1PPCAC_1406, partial [Pristionchus entomophagus]
VSTVCFVPNTSFDRREALQIIPGGLSLLACQIICTDEPACLAIQLTTTGNCVLFGGVISATFGQCPAPFTCLLKSYIGCAPKARRPIDLGYIAHYCSGPVQQVPFDNGTSRPCGAHSAGNRTVYIDALMHDGTNEVFENSLHAEMYWDDGIGSWYIRFRTTTAGNYSRYFLAAKCVRPRAIPVPECECEALPIFSPVEQPHIYSNPTPPSLETLPACPVSIQWFAPNFRSFFIYTPQNGARLYCANKVWMQVNDWTGYDETSSIATSASCVDRN